LQWVGGRDNLGLIEKKKVPTSIAKKKKIRKRIKKRKRWTTKARARVFRFPNFPGCTLLLGKTLARGVNHRIERYSQTRGTIAPPPRRT